MTEPQVPAGAAVDEALAPFHAFLASLLAIPEPLVDETTGEGLRVDSLRISLPFELDALAVEGRVRLAGGPPVHYTETSFASVLHQLRVEIVAEPPAPAEHG